MTTRTFESVPSQIYLMITSGDYICARGASRFYLKVELYLNFKEFNKLVTEYQKTIFDVVA